MSYLDKLEKKVLGTVVGSMGALAGGVGRAHGYLKVHEEPVEKETTIRAANSTYLAIPMPHIRKQDGTALPLSFWQNTFVIKSKTVPDSLIVFQRVKGGKPKPIYWLRKSVKVSGRPAVRPAYNHIRPRLVERLEGAAIRVFSKL